MSSSYPVGTRVLIPAVVTQSDLTINPKAATLTVKLEGRHLDRETELNLHESQVVPRSQGTGSEPGPDPIMNKAFRNILRRRESVRAGVPYVHPAIIQGIDKLRELHSDLHELEDRISDRA